MAAWLWAGKEAVVAGTSAAALLGAEWVDAQAPAELITYRRRPPPFIITRNETLQIGEATMIDGIPVTSAARTIFDLGRRPGLVTAAIRIDALMRAAGITAEDVGPLIASHRGARGMKQLRRVLALVDAGAESPQETRTRLVLIRAACPGRRHRSWCATCGARWWPASTWVGRSGSSGWNTTARSTGPTRASAPTTSTARRNWSIGDGVWSGLVLTCYEIGPISSSSGSVARCWPQGAHSSGAARRQLATRYSSNAVASCRFADRSSPG